MAKRVRSSPEVFTHLRSHYIQYALVSSVHTHTPMVWSPWPWLGTRSRSQHSAVQHYFPSIFPLFPRCTCKDYDPDQPSITPIHSHHRSTGGGGVQTMTTATSRGGRRCSIKKRNAWLLFLVLCLQMAGEKEMAAAPVDQDKSNHKQTANSNSGRHLQGTQARSCLERSKVERLSERLPYPPKIEKLLDAGKQP